MFKFPHREKKPSVSFYGKPVDIKLTEDKSVTIDDYINCRANSDGFEALYPKLNDEALIAAVQKTLDNCGYKDNIIYEGALQNLLVPELLKRLAQKNLKFLECNVCRCLTCIDMKCKKGSCLKCFKAKPVISDCHGYTDKEEI